MEKVTVPKAVMLGVQMTKQDGVYNVYVNGVLFHKCKTMRGALGVAEKYFKSYTWSKKN